MARISEVRPHCPWKRSSNHCKLRDFRSSGASDVWKGASVSLSPGGIVLLISTQPEPDATQLCDTFQGSDLAYKGAPDTHEALFGTTYGFSFSFVDMIHILYSSSTSANESMASCASSVQA